MSYKYIIHSDNYLCHFNPNHDPKSGRFTFKKAYQTIDTAVAKGYDVAEKVVRGAVKGIGYEFKKNNSKSKPNITPKNTSTIENSEPKSADSFKTKELDEKAKIISPVIDKVVAISKLPWLRDNDDAIEKWGSEYTKAADIGLEALARTNLREAYDPDIGITNGDRSWFVLEDQTFGMPQVAYLASIGKTNKEISDIISANRDLERANNEYTNQWSILKDLDAYNKAVENSPYKSDWYLYEAYHQDSDSIDDEYINACIQVAKEMAHLDTSTYLIHYNKNHSSKNGQFVSGDGDGDGQINDNAHRSKKEGYNADGHKKGVYSAKIENYHKGNAFHEAYYIDKRGNKRSYTSFKDMPVEAQNTERARQKGKKVVKEVGGQAVRTAASIGLQMAARSFLGF